MFNLHVQLKNEVDYNALDGARLCMMGCFVWHTSVSAGQFSCTDCYDVLVCVFSVRFGIHYNLAGHKFGTNCMLYV
jgi:hypothetical protein